MTYIISYLIICLSARISLRFYEFLLGRSIKNKLGDTFYVEYLRFMDEKSPVSVQLILFMACPIIMATWVLSESDVRRFSMKSSMEDLKYYELAKAIERLDDI